MTRMFAAIILLAALAASLASCALVTRGKVIEGDKVHSSIIVLGLVPIYSNIVSKEIYDQNAKAKYEVMMREEARKDQKIGLAN